MSTQKDGGSAFPNHETADTYNDEKGMSLRDYFAAKAIYRASAPNTEGATSYTPDWHAMARDCYAIADAMLKARQS